MGTIAKSNKWEAFKSEFISNRQSYLIPLRLRNNDGKSREKKDLKDLTKVKRKKMSGTRNYFGMNPLRK